MNLNSNDPQVQQPDALLPVPELHEPPKTPPDAEAKLTLKRPGPKMIAYFVFVLAFVAYLLFANQILAAITRAPTDLSKIEHSLEEFTTSAPTFAAVENVKYLGGLKRNVRFYGWAFSESALGLNPDEKTTQLVLSGPSGIFAADSVISIRPDIYFANQAEHKLASSSLGFEAIFSTLPLKDGRYDVYLYVQENDEIGGLAFSGTSVHVNGSEVYDTALGPIENISDPIPSDAVRLGIDQFIPDTTDPSVITISGWALHMDTLEGGEKAFLQLSGSGSKKATYEIPFSQPRPDLVEAYGISDAATPGFARQCKLPSGFGSVEQVDVIYESNGQAFISAVPYTIRDVNEGADLFAGGTIAVEKRGEQPPVENLSGVQSSKNTRLGIDGIAPTEGDEKLVMVSGWGVVLGELPQPQKTYLEVTGTNGELVTYSFDMTGERPDLVEIFEVPAGTLAGFSQDIRLPDSMDEIAQINIVFSCDGTLYRTNEPYNATA